MVAMAMAMAKQLRANYQLQLTKPLSPRAPPSLSPGTRGGRPAHLCLARATTGGLQGESFRPPWWLEVPPEKPNWLPPAPPKGMRRKRRDGEGASSGGAGGGEESAVRRAFSSMVFMIREIHSYTLLLRELLFMEDLRGVLLQVQREVHASFCWLFHHIFSCTPALMLSLMLLLANFTVHSMSHSALAALPPPPPAAADTLHRPSPPPPKAADAPAISGGGGKGTKLQTVAGAADDGRPGAGRTSTASSEAVAWRRVLEEAELLGGRHEALRNITVRRALVAPVAVEAETDRWYPEYFRTELVYRHALEEHPDDPLLLSNYAQFLFLVVHDHVRAEEYFQRAIKQQPPDAGALSRYANFLWVAKKDLCTAEETFLEAIATDPGNTTYAADYAHFLWSTGGDETCFPLDA